MDADNSNHNPKHIFMKQYFNVCHWPSGFLCSPGDTSQGRCCVLRYKCTYRNVNNCLILDQSGKLQWSHLTAGFLNSPKKPLITTGLRYIKHTLYTTKNVHAEPEKRAFILTQTTKLHSHMTCSITVWGTGSGPNQWPSSQKSLGNGQRVSPVEGIYCAHRPVAV